MKLPGKSDKAYWDLIEQWAKMQSDGCTGVPDFYVQACWEHDYHHKYGCTLFGDPITFEETNTRFRQVIQMHSMLRWFSPLSWTRWIGVHAGKPIWDEHRKRNLPQPKL